MSSVFIMDAANRIAKDAVAARENGNIELAEKLDRRWRVKYYEAAHYWDSNSFAFGAKKYYLPLEEKEKIMLEEMEKRKNG